jgi:hypothetical protein
VRREARARAWRRAASRPARWRSPSGSSLGAAHLAVKAHLVRRGRWRLPLDEPVFGVRALDS